MVYVGFDTPRPLGSHEYGATLALPIFADTMKEVEKQYPSQPFAKPIGISDIAINYHTGKRATSSEKNTITEYFKEGDDLPEYENSNSDSYGY